MDSPVPPEPAINPAARITVRRMGRELQPLVIVDDVLLNPEEVRAWAVAQAYADAPDGSYYPGRNGVLPPAYGQRLTTVLRRLLERVFGFPPNQSLVHEGFFGLATTPAEALQPLQAIPHFDSLNARRIACVHYFCGPPYHGTAFFRHAAPGYETLDARRVDGYRRTVFEEMESRGDGARVHVRRDMPFFEEVDYVEAAFNRLAVYRTTSLHAGILGETPLAPGPEQGRLTANSFIEMHQP